MFWLHMICYAYISTRFTAMSTDSADLYNSLIDGYSKKVRPVLLHNKTVDVNVSMSLLNINNFDELTGELGLSVQFSIAWTDQIITWTPDEHASIESLLFNPDDIWHPQIFVHESFSKMQDICNVSVWIRVSHNGSVVWVIGNVLSVTCSVDVTYFPFDTQECAVTFSTMNANSKEIALHTTLNQARSYSLAPNSEWTLEDINIIESIRSPTSPSLLKVVLKLKRRADFFCVYIIVPVIFLGILNNLVFLMPHSSGERNSVAITAFLSFVVFLPVINDSVPKSSAPVAYIYYYVMFLLLYSSLIMFMCIVSLCIYDKNGAVPEKVQLVVRLLKLKWLKWLILKCQQDRKSNIIKVQSSEVDDGRISKEINANGGPLDNETIAEVEAKIEIMWIDVGKTFDTYCMVINLIIYALYTTVTFSCLHANVGLQYNI